MRFCVKCGKTIDKGVFCRKCKTVKVHWEPFDLKVCACRRVLDRGQWLHKDINYRVTDWIKKQVRTAVVSSHIDFATLNKGKNQVKVRVSHNQEAHVVSGTISVQPCEICQRMKSGYFEGVLQLRNASDDAVTFVEQEVEANKDKGVFISKRVPFKDGVDFYLSDQRFIQNLGNKLYEGFGGVKKVNARLHTRDHARSKDIYRVTVLVELPTFKSGDVVKVGENLLWVQEVSKEVAGMDLKLQKKLRVTYKAGAFQVLPKYKTHVTKLYPHLEVINPLDYQSIMVKNKVRSPHPNQEVEVVIDKGVYVVE